MEGMERFCELLSTAKGDDKKILEAVGEIVRAFQIESVIIGYDNHTCNASARYLSGMGTFYNNIILEMWGCRDEVKYENLLMSLVRYCC